MFVIRFQVMTYQLGSLRQLEESLRQEMLEKDRRKSMKADERKKQLDVNRLLETSLQDAQLRFKKRDFKNALVLFCQVSWFSCFVCVRTGFGRSFRVKECRGTSAKQNNKSMVVMKLYLNVYDMLTILKTRI